MNGIIGTIISIIGIFCNIILVITILDKDMRSCFTILLTALSIWDSGFIIFMLKRTIPAHFLPENVKCTVCTYLLPYVTFPGTNFCLTASIFMTVAVSLERYFIVKNPSTVQKSKIIRSLIYLIPVIISSVIFNLPRYFEMELHHYDDINGTKQVYVVPSGKY